MTIELEAARALLNFGKRIGEGPRAEEQLRGAVAIHNILETHRVAYLADEVGMGKTYVALGAVALFRHFNPQFRVLFIAPRENIQNKWQKELLNFTAHNVQFSDFRVRGLEGRPARALVHCDNLLGLVYETTLDPNRDFFVRLPSFSLALGENSDGWKKFRDDLRELLPWFDDEVFNLKSKQGFKKNFARAVGCALPRFDLVVVDEAHNLKHGFSTTGSARNQVLGEIFGRAPADDRPDPKLFPNYGSRAGRVLFLSATPIEETYRQLWNQLDMFGLADDFSDLRNESVSEERKKEVAGRFLVRRVTSIPVGNREHTKNMYRREWRAGGVHEHDHPIRVTDLHQRLVIALIQKKVSELLGKKQFNRSFQIGMLASFESFLQTAKIKRDDGEAAIFDDPEQTDVPAERDGIDVHDVNRLAKKYKKKFGKEMPHPKMDAVVERLASTWITGTKHLVFVRRVGSVKELKRKLDERYNDWIVCHLKERLTPELKTPFDAVVERYKREKSEAAGAAVDDSAQSTTQNSADEGQDPGGIDTFFAWFFRGEGPRGLLSGANLQGRFLSGSGAYSTFFAHNHVMDLLGAKPGQVLDSLSLAVGISPNEASQRIRERAAKYLSRRAKVITRAARMEASQAAALELLRDADCGSLSWKAAVILQERYAVSSVHLPAREAPPEIANALERTTFFTTLREPENDELRRRIWPVPSLPDSTPESFRIAFREQELRGELLSSAARLGHAFIDLYLVAMSGRSTFESRKEVGAEAGESMDRESDGTHVNLIREYVALLTAQSRLDNKAGFGAFHELEAISSEFNLIVDVNIPDARTITLGESTRLMSNLLRKQQPTAGMFGKVSQTAVKQFRMPGYPFVLVTTDLLQEGEDLHTFCSHVHHYGISWTASSMEQRIGRVDRVRSLTDRKLPCALGEVPGEDWLQVFFPYLEDTIEVLQVERVLDRMNTFLRLMHEGLTVPVTEDKRIEVGREMVSGRKRVPAIREPLKSAFPVPETAVRGSTVSLAVDDQQSTQLMARFGRLLNQKFTALSVEWSPNSPTGSLLGTAKLPNGRIQPFTLLLKFDLGRPVVRCISPVGRVGTDEGGALQGLVARLFCRVGAIQTKEERQYDLTVEDDVLLGNVDTDVTRLEQLLVRVTHEADQLELGYFQDERDTPINAFEQDLRGEVGREN
ncbi:MAG: DEAD/DEAH box helicase [Polyangiaceae bacterium]|nr:DEAD/DEAH box helicase [Polyangiaceae bacterium]